MVVDYKTLMGALVSWRDDVKEIQSKEQKKSFSYIHSQICIECIQSVIDIVNDNTEFSDEELKELYGI